MSRHAAIRSAAAALALCLLAGTAPCQELGPDAQMIDTRANDLYGEIMSPFCPGRTLANCPSPQAATMRGVVRQQLAAGMSEDEIVDSLYGVYGEIVLGSPRAEGIGILAWVMPAAFLLLGVGLLAAWLRSAGRRTAVQAPVPPPALNPEEQARLDAELSEL